MPFMSRLRLLRHWGGIMDMTPDGSPFICKTPIKNLYLNGGWCYGGFKATPACGWTFAHTIAHDDEHELNRRFALDRFAAGREHRRGGHRSVRMAAMRCCEFPAPLRSERPERIPLRRRRHEQRGPGTTKAI